MKEQILKLLGVLVIYAAFLPASLISWASTLVYLGVGQKQKAEDVFNATNRMISVMFGGDGKKATSPTCGQKLIDGTADWRCCLLCRILHFFDKDHCIKEAKS